MDFNLKAGEALIDSQGNLIGWQLEFDFMVIEERAKEAA
jgi:hypothetical protein